MVTQMMNPATNDIFHGVLFLLKRKTQVIQTWAIGRHFSENELSITSRKTSEECLAGSFSRATLNLGIVSLSPMLGVGIT